MSLKQLMFKPKLGPSMRARNKTTEANIILDTVNNPTGDIKRNITLNNCDTTSDIIETVEGKVKNHNDFASEETLQSIATYLGSNDKNTLVSVECDINAMKHTGDVGNRVVTLESGNSEVSNTNKVSGFTSNNSKQSVLLSENTKTGENQDIKEINSGACADINTKKCTLIKERNTECLSDSSVGNGCSLSHLVDSKSILETSLDVSSNNTTSLFKNNFKPRPGPKIGSNVRSRKINESLENDKKDEEHVLSLLEDTAKEISEVPSSDCTKMPFFKKRPGPVIGNLVRSRAQSNFRSRSDSNLSNGNTQKLISCDSFSKKNISTTFSIDSVSCALDLEVIDEGNKEEKYDSVKSKEIFNQAKNKVTCKDSQEICKVTHKSNGSLNRLGEVIDYDSNHMKQSEIKFDKNLNVNVGIETSKNEISFTVLKEIKMNEGTIEPSSVDLVNPQIFSKAVEEKRNLLPENISSNILLTDEEFSKSTLLNSLKNVETVLPSEPENKVSTTQGKVDKDDTSKVKFQKGEANVKSKSVKSYQKPTIKPKLTIDKLKRPSKFTVSTYGKMSFEVRQNMQKKFGDGVPDMSKMTMMDLIFYNPETSPMTYKSSCESLGDISKGDISEKLQDENEEKEEGSKPKDDKDVNDAVPVPQLTLSADGKVVVAQDSLKVKQTTSFITDNSFPLVKKAKTVSERQSWSFEDTVKFYKALKTIGSDFEMMKSVFPERSRRSLKSKFKREERLNGRLIDKVMTLHSEYDLHSLEKELEEVEQFKEITKNVKRGPPSKRRRVSGGREKMCALPVLSADDVPPMGDTKKCNHSNKKTSAKKVIKMSRKRSVQSSDSEDEDSEVESLCRISIRSDRPRRKVFSRFHLSLFQSQLNKMDNNTTSPQKVYGKTSKSESEKTIPQDRIIINTNIDFESVKYSKSISYDPNNLTNPIDINETIAH